MTSSVRIFPETSPSSWAFWVEGGETRARPAARDAPAPPSPAPPSRPRVLVAAGGVAGVTGPGGNESSSGPFRRAFHLVADPDRDGSEHRQQDTLGPGR
ncbi:hypothetical protein PAL_GLEAN10011030 [Pteropus alecto]|uniref:Uncharacterized protein n=1 Tax=Pteropus alecto TaxID=9402 RepID=L5KVC6_PTEAL|nr:hypothetical protein PAL_GLEAN10011030 [Pteropus alecto]